MADDREPIRLTPTLERLLPVLLFGWVAVILVVGWSDTTFVKDDWSFLLDRRGDFDTAIANPYNEHIVVGLSLIYRGLVGLFGLNPVPFRILLTVAFLASSVLVFVYVRRRVGVVLGLLGTATTLLMGSAYQDLLWPVQVGFMVSFACGLGALMLLERDERRTDVLAAVLLVVSTLTFTVGLAFLAGATVSILCSERRRSRWWVVVPAAVLFVAWWIGWGSSSDSAVDLNNVLTSPVYIFNGFAASFAAILGMDNPQNSPTISGLQWGQMIAAVAAVGGVIRLRQLGRIPASLAVITSTALAYWFLLACFETPERQVDVSRLHYAGAVFVLLIVAELMAGMRIRRGTAIVLTVLAAAAIASNADHWGHAAARFDRATARERAGLTAIELMGDQSLPDFTLSRPLIGTGFVPVRAAAYLAALDDYGHSPAYSEAELTQAPQKAKVAADRALTAGLDVGLSPVRTPTRSCDEIALSGDVVTVRVPPGGGVEFTAAEKNGFAGVRAQLGRYSRSFPTRLGRIPPGHTAELRIPPDNSSRSWLLQLTPAPERTCMLPAQD